MKWTTHSLCFKAWNFSLFALCHSFAAKAEQKWNWRLCKSYRMLVWCSVHVERTGHVPAHSNPNRSQRDSANECVLMCMNVNIYSWIFMLWYPADTWKNAAALGSEVYTCDLQNTFAKPCAVQLGKNQQVLNSCHHQKHKLWNYTGFISCPPFSYKVVRVKMQSKQAQKYFFVFFCTKKIVLILIVNNNNNQTILSCVSYTKEEHFC